MSGTLVSVACTGESAAGAPSSESTSTGLRLLFDVDVQDGTAVASDDKVIIGLTSGLDDPERVLLAYLMGVEALRKGKQVLLWLTKDGVHVATEGYAAQVEVPDAPSVAALHEEYVSSGGRFYACPVCVKTRGMQDATLVEGAEIKGAPSVYEFAEGGALTFNY